MFTVLKVDPSERTFIDPIGANGSYIGRHRTSLLPASMPINPAPAPSHPNFVQSEPLFAEVLSIDRRLP